MLAGGLAELAGGRRAEVRDAPDCVVPFCEGLETLSAVSVPYPTEKSVVSRRLARRVKIIT